MVVLQRVNQTGTYIKKKKKHFKKIIRKSENENNNSGKLFELFFRHVYYIVYILYTYEPTTYGPHV